MRHIFSVISAIALIVWEAPPGFALKGLTPEQETALSQLKAKVSDKITEDFMKDDRYMVGFLETQEFNVDQAVELFEDNIQWRKENNLTTIESEDYSDVEADYKVYVESVDLEGRPTITANFGDWDLRKAVVAGKMKRLERYITRCSEIVYRKVLKQEAAGKDIRKFNLVVNMNNYNLHQHGCEPCIPFYIFVTNSYERHWPGTVNKIFLINTPPTFELILKIIIPLMSPPTREALKVFNQDKTLWEPKLLELMSPSEIPQELGGTKEYNGTIAV